MLIRRRRHRVLEVAGGSRSAEIGQAPDDFDHFHGEIGCYSFGITCYEILTGNIPLDEYPRSRYEVVLFGKLRLQLPDGVHPGFVNLIHRCWHQDPDCGQFLGCIDTSMATVFGLDEEYISTLSTLGEDLNYFQNLLDANNEGSLPAEGFACGCEYVSGVRKFLQRFGYGNVDESVGNNSAWGELID